MQINPDLLIGGTNKSFNSIKNDIDTLSDRDIYKSTEQVVGTWIDGKPVYRQVFSNYFNDEYNNWYKIGTINNIDNVIYTYGAIKLKSSGDYVNFPRATMTDQKSSDIYISSQGNVMIRIANATGQLYLVVEYTKKS